MLGSLKLKVPRPVPVAKSKVCRNFPDVSLLPSLHFLPRSLSSPLDGRPYPSFHPTISDDATMTKRDAISALFRYARFPATLTYCRGVPMETRVAPLPPPPSIVSIQPVSRPFRNAGRRTENREVSAPGLSHPLKLSARRVNSDRPLDIRPTCKFAVFPILLFFEHSV